jgi:hypothetical protein
MKFESQIFACGNSRTDPLLVEVKGADLGSEEIDYITCGAYYACIKTTQGNIWTVGRNDEAQLCHGPGEALEWDNAKMVDDATIKNKVISVACGYYHTMIVVGMVNFENKVQ